MRVFVIGFPGDIGGACTELWHTIKLWRKFDVDVHLIPTWATNASWRQKVDSIGCITHDGKPEHFASIEGLAGSLVVSFCNSEFLLHAQKLRDLGCRLIWVNCMTFLFEQEKQWYGRGEMFDAFVFQSEFQREELEPQLESFGYQPGMGHLIRGAFDLEEFEFAPRHHEVGDVFVVGRMARPDLDKWSSNTWPIYSAIQYANKRAIMLGINDRVQEKLGASPIFADCLKPGAIPVQQFLANLHCLLPVNGGARENWPRAGLEAMASGVPVVAQNDWGWQEMIDHGETGFLANNDCELAHYAATLAYDETLRQRIIESAFLRLADDLANGKVIWEKWQSLFESLQGDHDVPGIPHARTFHGTQTLEEVA